MSLRCLPGLALLFLLLPLSATQAEEPRSLRDYTHTAWLQKDGAPPGVWAMAESTDGWLWLGSGRGLTRFDGTEFETVDLLGEESSEPRSVSQLYATPSGDLWVIFHCGKIKLLPHSDPQQARDIAPPQGGGIFSQLLVDSDNRVWAYSQAGLFLYSHGGWRSPGLSWNAPAGGPDAMLLEGDGTLWVITKAGDRRLRRGSSRFEAHDSGLEHGDSILYGSTPDGRLWSSGEEPLRLGSAVEGQTGAFSRSSARSNGLIVDEESTAWSIVTGDVSRVPNARGSTPKQLDAPSHDRLFTVSDGLSSGSAMTVMEDHTGTVWVGTPQGLDRFRRNDFRVSGLPPNLRYFAVAAEDHGEVIVGTAVGNSNEDGVWRIGKALTRIPGHSSETTALHVTPDGELLVGGNDGIWSLRADRLSRDGSIPITPKEKVQAMANDFDGHLWAAFKKGPVMRKDGDHWLAKGRLAGLPDTPPIYMRAAGNGDLWQGYYANLVTITSKNNVRTFSDADGIHTVTVSAIDPGNPTLIGGERGLAWFDGQTFHAFKSDTPDALNGVTGILRTADGTLWLNGYEGAIRIAKQDLRRAILDPDFTLPVRVFSADEGVPGAAQQVRPLPTLTEGSDGRLWFATSGGLVWVKPSDLAIDFPSPPVVIRAIKAGATLGRLDAPIRLPAGTRALSVKYTAVELGKPDSLRFRYRLDGVDSTWQAAGTRREAFYTNLSPGTYQFRVSASRSGGDWTGAQTTLSFSIAPAFYQTGWFVSLCVVGALLVFRLWYVLRVRQITRSLRSRLQDRHAERERIARELHDTLLQGVSALLLDFRVLTRQLSDGPPKASLTRALERGEAAVNEGRERVGELRADSVEIYSLEAALAAFALEFDGADAPIFSLQVTGRARRLNPITLDELHRIGREVLFNAYAHAKASKIDITLTFRSSGLQLRLADNGIGIDPDVLIQGGKPGHWGLRGIQERAKSIGAELNILSDKAQGTEILVNVPAARAYPARRRSVFGLRVTR